MVSPSPMRLPQSLLKPPPNVVDADVAIICFPETQATGACAPRGSTRITLALLHVASSDTSPWPGGASAWAGLAATHNLLKLYRSGLAPAAA